MGPNKVKEVVKNIDKVTSEGDVYLARESKWKWKPPEVAVKKVLLNFQEHLFWRTSVNDCFFK